MKTTAIGHMVRNKRVDFFTRLAKMQRVRYFQTFLGRRFYQCCVSSQVTLQFGINYCESILHESEQNMRYTLDLHH